MSERIFEVEIRGTAPLLMNRFTDESGSKKTKKIYDDQEEAEKRLYLDENGKLYQPGEHIERALQLASKNFKYGGRKSYYDFVRSAVFVQPEKVIHIIQDWKIDKRPVVIQKRRIMRCRPLLKNWQLKFQLHVIDENIDAEVLKEILEYAGRFIGLGDNRPRYGRFKVIQFK